MDTSSTTPSSHFSYVRDGGAREEADEGEYVHCKIFKYFNLNDNARIHKGMAWLRFIRVQAEKEAERVEA